MALNNFLNNFLYGYSNPGILGILGILGNPGNYGISGSPGIPGIVETALEISLAA